MIFLLSSTPLGALLLLAAEGQGDAPQFETGGGLLWMLLQTFFVLAFVCALAFVVIRLLPRMMPKRRYIMSRRTTSMRQLLCWSTRRVVQGGMPVGEPRRATWS